MLITDSKEKLYNILTTVTIESDNEGLQLDAMKIENSVIFKLSAISVCNILCKGERIIQIGAFKFLGSTITPDAKCET